MASYLVALPEFLWNNEVYNLQLCKGVLHVKCVKAWKLLSLSSFDKQIDLLDVISATHDTGIWRIDSCGEPIIKPSLFNIFQSTSAPCFVLTIKCRIKLKQHLRKFETIKLQTHNEKDSVVLCELINQQVHENLKMHNIVRPHKLLVFVDPTCGKKKAEPIHKEIVSPLFQSAGIKQDVVLMKYQGYAKEYIESCDLSKYDGVIAISGDATFCEVANAVFITEQKNQGVALDWDNVEHNKPLGYVKPSIKLGVIPAGAANMISCTTQGVSDPETATLQLICGESHSLDVCSIHDFKGRFVSFSFTSTTFGTISQIPELAKSLTMFGLFRFDIATLAVLANHLSCPCEISFLPSNSVDVSKDTSRCRFPCDVCLCDSRNQIKTSSPESAQNTSAKENNCGDWRVFRGSYHMVNSFSNAMVYDKSPLGLAPSAHLADGTADLVLVHKTSRAGIISYARSLRGTSNCFDFPFVEVHRVKGFRFRPIAENQLTSTGDHPDDCGSASGPRNLPDTSEGVWCVDGEAVKGHGFTVWVHRGLADIFAKGIEDD